MMTNSTQENTTIMIVLIVSIALIFIQLKSFIVDNEMNVDKLEYYKGFVAEVHTKRVWLAQDINTDVHSFKQRHNVFYFETIDSEVLSKLRTAVNDTTIIVEVWYDVYVPSRRVINGHTSNSVYQIALNGEIIVQYGKSIFWRIILIIGLICLAIYCIRALSKTKN